MKTELSDVIHLYLGCECLDASNVTYALKPSHLPSNWRACDHSHKLLLRQFSSMTEEENICVAKLLAWDYLSDFAKSAQVVNLFKDNGFYKKTTNLTGNQWNKVINYLRSVGIDCDGLIDEGFAIDKTKIAK